MSTTGLSAVMTDICGRGLNIKSRLQITFGGYVDKLEFAMDVLIIISLHALMRGGGEYRVIL